MKPNARRHETPGGELEPAKSAPHPAPRPDGNDSKFDRLVYERVRLGIMSALAVNEPLTTAPSAPRCRARTIRAQAPMTR